MAVLYDKCSVSSAQNKTLANGRLWWHPEKKKGKPGEKSCGFSLSFKIQWFLHSHAPRQRRTRSSELICKHRVLQEAAEAGHFTFPSSPRELSGRYRYTMLHQTGSIPRDFCRKIQFKFRGSRNKCFEKLVAHRKTSSVTPFRFAPAGLCIFKVSHESQMHIAGCSGLIIKKWGHVIREGPPWE